MRSHASFAKNVLLSNFRRLGFPYKLTFVTTYRCNYRCKTCNIWQRRPEGELTLDEIRRFFRKSPGFNWIDFTGGEPWLRKDFPQIVEAAIEHCPELVLVHFPTNGYLTEQIVSGVGQILERGPKKLIITVSMDGDERVNDSVRGMPGGWCRQVETYRRLHAMPGVEVVLGLTLSSFNVGEYERAFAAAKRACPWLEPRDFHLNVAHQSGHYYGNGSTPGLRDRLREIATEVQAYAATRGSGLRPVDLLERAYLSRATEYLRSGRTPLRCQALRASCFVDSWGNVYPCGMYDAKIASLRDHDFDLREIWELPRARELQAQIWSSQCPQCWTPCEAYQTILGSGFGLRRAQGRSEPKLSADAAPAS